ncbi:MAG: aminotransferase class V-fold PLP-dependent enzyme, partial [FCB group bacterium]
MEFGHKIRNKWLLDENITFINHGSFGATPIKVLGAANRYTEELEREPLKFILEDYFGLIRKTADKIASFFGTKEENLVFVDNATTGVNTVLRALQHQFKPGDELLTVNHVYPAVRNAMQYIADVTGAKYVEIDIPFPTGGNEQIIEIVKKSLTTKTKIAIFDHITSSTGIIFPVKELAELCRQNGTYCLIDGAHAPGMLDLNIPDINADWYVGNLHKWLFAPKGCAILWASDYTKDLIHPLSISLEYKQGFTHEFDWTGTKNPAPFLAASDALDFYNELGKNEIISYIHNLAVDAR